MSCVFDIFLVLFLTLILQSQGEGGQCSSAKEAECSDDWRTCLNEQCGVCILEIDGECYDPNYDQGALLERLENCDPNVDPDCKRSLENVSDQLLEHLETRTNDGAIDSDRNLSKLTKSTKSITENDSNASNLRRHKKTTQPTTPSETLSSQENDSVGFDSEEISRETSALSKKHPDKKHNKDNGDDIPDVYFLIIIIACTLSGVAGIALSGYCWYKLHYSDDKLDKGDYIPGVKKQNSKSPPSKNGDRKLDYKAEMYHYVHTKNQIAAMEKAKSDHLSSGAMSNDEDDDDEVEDYTVYECPGLAPTGDMTVVNPLFSDQEVSMSDEGRAQSNHSSPNTPSRSNHSPSR